ncbi:uncharacterized protein RHO25_003425 [Cercospora beticola]|uniref:Myb-like domain-containing protein n=1 Tax=Cercospora beticola TaxID=122368 RepID=A0ABZ0NH14_CERBT|nr:hypothetical protein RHO25_003425 [Cercospora beticola]
MDSSGQRQNGDWTQDELNQLRALLADGKRLCDAAAVLKRSRYAVLQVSKFDARKNGWWTPERPDDVGKFRQNKDVRRLESGEFEVEEKPESVPRQRWTEAEYLKALEMRESGMSLREIANRLHRSLEGVRNQFQRRRSNQDIPFAVGPWTPVEDEQLRTLRKDGHSFQEIQKAIPHRTSTSIKRRISELRTHINKRSTPGRWGEEEIALLRQLRSKGLEWKDVSAQLPGRSATACRTLYRKVTSENIARR